MEDLIAIQSKSVAELREIAKVLGITEEKLSKKELIARISSIGAAEEREEGVKEEVAPVVEAAAPQKRKRARLGSVKVEAVRKVVAEDAAAEEVKVDNKESNTVTPVEDVKVEVEAAPQPKKRGRKPKNAIAEVVAQPEAPEVEPKAEEEQPEDKKEKPITKDDFTAEVYGEGVLEVIPDGYGFL